MDLWWDEQDRTELLYAGLWELPIASIYRANVYYSYITDIPLNTLGWKQYMPKEELKAALEKAAHQFFDFANTNRPAMEAIE